MTIVPQNNYILCKKNTEVKNDTGAIVIGNLESFNTYEIVSVSENLSASEFAVGDVIVVNSTGTTINDGVDDYFLFNVENIVAKVI